MSLPERILDGDLNALRDYLKDQDPLAGIYKHNRTILHVSDRIEIIRVLIEHFSATCELRHAVNMRDDKGRTPLIVHCKRFPYHYGGDDEEIIKLLLQNHADPNVQGDRYGMTALHYLVAGDLRNDLIQILLDFNPAPTLRTHTGHTAQSLAKACDMPTTEKLLQEYTLTCQRMLQLRNIKGALH